MQVQTIARFPDYLLVLSWEKLKFSDLYETWESMSIHYGLLPKSLFACSETFFDKSRACSRRCQNSPFGLNQLTSQIFRVAKICKQKAFQCIAQRNFCLGNSPLRHEPISHLCVGPQSGAYRSSVRFVFILSRTR